MEFVLMTTTSTPESSRSGSSVMKFGDYREDEDAISEASTLHIEREFIQYSSDSDDEDKVLLDGFNELTARQHLVSYDHCTKIVLDQEQQRGLKLEIGVHVSDENPWKQIKKQILLDYLPADESSTEEITDFRSKLKELNDDDYVLVGYASALNVADEDTFLLYADVEAAKGALTLIQRLEAFERRKINKTIYKYPRPWKSGGSEKEVDLQLERKQTTKVEVEIQRLCPENISHKPFEFRFAEDARDGYVELVPKSNSIEIVRRRRISIGVQSAAQRVEGEQQTDPTFPANAWTQYFYEITPDEEDEEVVKIESDHENETKQDETEDNKDESKESKDHESIGPSDAIKELLQTLEFNSIDMYRNDYEFIAIKPITRYSIPYITEIFCFTEHARCLDRFVCSTAWHPTLSGVFVASYTYKTFNTFTRGPILDFENT